MRSHKGAAEGTSSTSERPEHTPFFGVGGYNRYWCSSRCWSAYPAVPNGCVLRAMGQVRRKTQGVKRVSKEANKNQF